MSIVYDYLKQIQAKKPLEKATPAVLPAAPLPVMKKVGSSLWIKIAVGILGCLLLGAGLYFFPPKVEKTTVKVYQAPEKPKTAARPETSGDGCILEGIIYNPSRPFAIINGKMLEVGGRVGDFEATQITSDSVSLKNLKDGTSRTIRL
ncbi:MAG: hypothetical protein WCJ71_05315 [Candidatus Omnitrophota bacterium]